MGRHREAPQAAARTGDRRPVSRREAGLWVRRSPRRAGRGRRRRAGRWVTPRLR